MKELKQSETKIIKRSQINLNPYNPKEHSDIAIKEQLKNLKKYGYLGGIVWNEQTGNLIDGHRRVLAHDIYYKYNGSDADYDIRVEVGHYTEQEELEQLTYMAIGNTKADMNLVAIYAENIDYKNIGLSEFDVNSLTELIGVKENDIEFEVLEIGFEKTDDEKLEYKLKVKEAKEKVKQKALEREKNEDAYITLSFSSFEAKEAFCNLLNIDTFSKYAKGEDVLNIIE